MLLCLPDFRSQYWSELRENYCPFGIIYHLSELRLSTQYTPCLFSSLIPTLQHWRLSIPKQTKSLLIECGTWLRAFSLNLAPPHYTQRLLSKVSVHGHQTRNTWKIARTLPNQWRGSLCRSWPYAVSRVYHFEWIVPMRTEQKERGWVFWRCCQLADVGAEGWPCTIDPESFY